MFNVHLKVVRRKRKLFVSMSWNQAPKVLFECSLVWRLMSAPAGLKMWETFYSILWLRLNWYIDFFPTITHVSWRTNIKNKLVWLYFWCLVIPSIKREFWRNDSWVSCSHDVVEDWQNGIQVSVTTIINKKQRRDPFELISLARFDLIGR